MWHEDHMLYDVGNLVLMLTSYMCTLLCPDSIVRGSHHHVGLRHRTPSTTFFTMSVTQLYT